MEQFYNVSLDGFGKEFTTFNKAQAQVYRIVLLTHQTRCELLNYFVLQLIIRLK